MASPISRLSLLMSCILLFVGCGQKGSLYLPEETPPPIQTAQPCRTAPCQANQAPEQEPEEPAKKDAMPSQENTE